MATQQSQQANRETRHAQLRAPRENLSTLIHPPLAEVAARVEANRQLRQSMQLDLQGRTLAQLVPAARAGLLRGAYDYTSVYRNVSSPDSTKTILLAGHQPQLFHPGVWCKNFALSGLAIRHDAVAVNLLIDNATAKPTSIRVLGGTVAQPVIHEVPLDRTADSLPFEQREIIDRSVFDSFADRAAAHIESLVPDPLVRKFWPEVIRMAQGGARLGGSIASARHALEAEWGQETLEIPQSEVCRLEAFAWFVAHVLAHLGRFHEVHQRAVADYRRVNRIRSAAHPVPDLVVQDDWLEAPFWIWSDRDPRRRPLFARQSGDVVLLSDRAQIRLELDLTPSGDGSRAVDQLASLAADGIKIRPRALTTTLFARLLLGDLFVHGIGGAKYDEITDVLFSEFLGATPPSFMVLSATLHLPIDRPAIGEEQHRQVAGQLRDLEYHPEQHIDVESIPDPAARAEVRELIEQKRLWIATEPTRASARQRCHAIRRVNESLQVWLETTRSRLVRERADLQRALRVESLLGSREYAFCLYPEQTLRNFLLEFSSLSS